MERRHSDILTARLEQVVDAGCGHILWNELYRWYGVQKIAARTYRDLVDRWEDVSEGKFGQLQMVRGAGKEGAGIYLIAEAKIEPLKNGGE